MSENETTSSNRAIVGNLPVEIEQALARYVEIQKESTVLQEEKYRLRDQIADYMEGKDTWLISPEVAGARFSVRNTVKTVVDYDEVLLKERLGDDYPLILWPDPAKIKKNLSLVAPLLTPILEQIGSPSPEAVKAAISGGKVKKELFEGAFKKRQTRLFSVSHERSQNVNEDGDAYDDDAQ